MARKPIDFRDMTHDDIRENISRLNRDIRACKEQLSRLEKDWATASVVMNGTAILYLAVVPPVGIGMAAVGLGYSTVLASKVSGEQKNLGRLAGERDSFKTVWRARAGRPYRDIPARLSRDKQRKKGPRR